MKSESLRREPAQNIVGLSACVQDCSLQLTYRQTESAVKRLAARFIAAFGRSELGGFCYMAIPRGGLFVLGMLSYVLDLSRESLLPPPPDLPLVVVDDCCFSGARFHHVLQLVENEQVIFAHLYSHPDLRAAIEHQEPRVVACLAAHDLRDLARERYPNEEEYRAWQERWRQRLPGSRYWIGLPELVIFPWNEPDRPVWNPLTEELEDNWRLTAPDRCLKNWARLGAPPSTEAQPTLRSPDAVAFSVGNGKVILCDLQTEQVYGLEDVAADMWRALTAYGDLDVAAEYLLSQYEVDQTRLRKDLRAFADHLLAKGLLERVHEPGNSKP